MKKPLSPLGQAIHDRMLAVVQQYNRGERGFQECISEVSALGYGENAWAIVEGTYVGPFPVKQNRSLRTAQ